MEGRIVFPTPAKATTDCLINAKALRSTVVRLKNVFSDQSCPHIAEAKPTCRRRISIFILLDSNCHSDLAHCDKAEGDWLWLIACNDCRSGVPIPLWFKVESLEPSIVKFNQPIDGSVTDHFSTDIPLWLFPYYAKASQHSCISSHIRIVRYPTYEFRRAPIDIKSKIGIDGNIEGRAHEQQANIAVAVPVKKHSNLTKINTVHQETIGIKDDSLSNRKERIEGNNYEITSILEEASKMLAEWKEFMDWGGKPSDFIKHQQNIERIKNQLDIHITKQSPLERDETDTLLQSIRDTHTKLDSLLYRQDILKQIIITRFDTGNTAIGKVLDYLDESYLPTILNILKDLNSKETIDDIHMDVLSLISEALSEIRHNQADFYHAIIATTDEDLGEAVADPSLDVKHKLKVAVPLIPFIMKYEGEFGLSSGLNLEKLRQWFTSMRKSR